MLAHVTNRARAVRGCIAADGTTVPLEPERTALIDLAEHPLHQAWIAAGDLAVVPLGDKEARAARKRLEAEADAAGRVRSAALAELTPAHPAAP